MDQNVRPLPQVALRDPVRFELQAIRTWLCRRLVRTAERGLSGKIPSKQAKGYAVGLKAAEILFDRVEPKPQPANLSLTGGGPLVVMWQGSSPASSPSPTPRDPSKPSSTPALPASIPGSVSWSATDDSARA